MCVWFVFALCNTGVSTVLKAVLVVWLNHIWWESLILIPLFLRGSDIFASWLYLCYCAPRLELHSYINICGFLLYLSSSLLHSLLLHPCLVFITCDVMPPQSFQLNINRLAFCWSIYCLKRINLYIYDTEVLTLADISKVLFLVTFSHFYYFHLVLVNENSKVF